MPRTQIRAEMMLALATLGWGMNYPLMKMALQHELGIWTLAVRFSLSFLIMLPLLWMQRQQLSWGSIKGVYFGLNPLAFG